MSSLTLCTLGVMHDPVTLVDMLANPAVSLSSSSLYIVHTLLLQNIAKYGQNKTMDAIT